MTDFVKKRNRVMKGLVKIVAALAAFAGVASCSKDMDYVSRQNEGQGTSVVEITASFGTTKVSYTEKPEGG